VNKNTLHSVDYSSALQDNFILEHYGLNELNYESVKSYRERFTAVKPNHPWNGLDTKEFLYKIGAWGKLRNNSKEGVTLAGLLMFSEERIITEVLPQYFLEYRETLTDIVNGTWSKRFTSQDGTWSGNLYDFYFKAINELTSHLAKNYGSDEELLRSALHEALVNSIVHADYEGEGGIVIEKEQNMFRFSNPGLFRISTDQAFQGGISNLRNPNLFKMFILIGLCKRAGSGLKSVELAWKHRQWSKPELAQNLQPERTILTLSVLSNGSKQKNEVEKVDELAATYEDVDSFAMEFEFDNNSVNNELNSVNKTKNSINKTKNSVNNELNSMNKGVNSVNNLVNSLNKEVNSVNNKPNSINNDLNSVNNEILSDHVHQKNKPDYIRHESTKTTANEEIQEEVDAELWNIAELARKKKRLNPSTMEEIILQLCSKRSLMLKELAYLLERTPDGLRNNYLAKLLSEGKIQLKYPDQPNHPKQAYMIMEQE
jgi:ATP-dependent DNA helicase RecG